MQKVGKTCIKDVRFFDTYYHEPQQKYINLTNFQAVERIAETGLKGGNTALKSLSKAIPYIETVMRNDVNDLLYKSQSTASVFLATLESQKEDNIDIVMVIFCLTLFLETVIILFYSIILYKQYKLEKRNMYAFIGVSKKEVEEIWTKVNQFKEMLQNQIRFDDLENDDVGNFTGINEIKKRKKILDQGKRVAILPNYHGMSIKYYIHFLKAVLVFIFLIGLAILNFVGEKNVLNTLLEKVIEQHAADAIQPRLSIGQTIFLDLASENDTTLVLNTKPSTILLKAIDDIKQVRTTDFELFRKKDGTYDPLIEDVLFGNACTYLTGDWKKYCDKMVQGSTRGGLTQLVTSYEMNLRDLNVRYHASNKTYAVTSGFLNEVYTKAVASMSFLASITSIITDHLSIAFDASVKDYKTSNNTLIFSSIAIVVLGCLFVHLRLLNKLRETENQFKNVLQTLPPKLILANTFLKTYLRRTSKGVFNSLY